MKASNQRVETNRRPACPLDAWRGLEPGVCDLPSSSAAVAHAWRYTAEILMSYRPIQSVLAIILSVVLSGCLSVGRSPQTLPAIAPVPLGMPKETTPLEAIIYNSKDDGPAELIKKNETIENMIVQKQQELNALYKKYSIFAINGYGEVEFTKSQKAWSELKELDSLFAGRGEHGSTLARYLYLCEKLRITEDRIQYLKKTFNH